MKKTKNKKDSKDKELEKINSLQEMIATAEQTISSAKQMLLKLQKENNITPARNEAPSQSFASSNEDGRLIHGTFDGQVMIGDDGKQYPVPANYASKSKLIEGDMLKLTITNDGNFVYKQIGPAERKYLIGIVQQDERGNYFIIADQKKYKVLLAAATYFKIEAGDEVTLVVPRSQESVWGAIENILRKASEIPATKERNSVSSKREDFEQEEETEELGTQSKPSAIERLEKEIELERKKRMSSDSIIDEWTPDIETLKKEASHPVGSKNVEEEL